MDEKFMLVGLIILSSCGLLFLGYGMTGFVVSQSCCFGPQCSLENMCDSAKPEVNNDMLSNSGIINVYLGLFFLVMSFLLVLSYYNENKNKRETIHR